MENKVQSRRHALRTLSFAATALLAGTGAALAQFPMPGISLGQKDKPPPTPEEAERQKKLDDAYRAATNKIPNQTPKTNDPWADVHTAPSTAKKKPQ